MNPVHLIIRKRDGHRLSSDEIRSLVAGLLSGDVADYQMSAWLMAAFLNGLDERETLALTDAMLESGRVLGLESVKRPKVDKHSTGGVGDKISICLAPAVAAAGVAVPMISGRGLGHTGGTLDKLESIPGYRTDLDIATFERVVATVGVSMIGQTSELAPADKRIYALRDVTGTVECIPLIVASILSKKLAEGIDGLVLDVKAGRGAFMKDVRSARRLAKALVAVGTRSNKRVRAVLTEMSAPIGTTIGNAIEVREALEVLRGSGPEDTVELTVELGAEMLVVGRVAKNAADGRKRIRKVLGDGTALDVFRRMVEAHGGDPRVADDDSVLPSAPSEVVVESRTSGYVRAVDAERLGLLSVAMGAGRARAEDAVDPAVGIELMMRVGARVARGEPLAKLHVRDRAAAEPWVADARAAFSIGRGRGARGQKSRIIERVG
jgi:pyrimidine-nucleoside phosphorylase